MGVEPTNAGYESAAIPLSYSSVAVGAFMNSMPASSICALGGVLLISPRWELNPQHGEVIPTLPIELLGGMVKYKTPF